jgi:type I restriction-modification system DNA methylase subunit
VVDHGEVYTRDREVNAMLDLVHQEALRIESRFLEPACGTGNFLIEVLGRKLNVVQERYRRNQSEYERYAFLAVTSLYGIDILQDNIEICRNRLFFLLDERYVGLYQKKT